MHEPAEGNDEGLVIKYSTFSQLKVNTVITGRDVVLNNRSCSHPLNE